MTRPGSLRLLGLCALLALPAALIGEEQSRPAAVAILRSVAWQPGDSVRDGAGEFAVYLQAAQLQRTHRAAGLVAVCDRHGNLRSGGERALRRLVLSGLVVVKLARDASLDGEEHAAFLNGGQLAPEVAAEILARCLERHGAPPVAADPEKPSAAELAALRAYLQPMQTALSAATGRQLAQR